MIKLNSKKAMEMSWTMIGWMVLAVIALIVIVFIIIKGTAPGLGAFNLLGGN